MCSDRRQSDDDIRNGRLLLLALFLVTLLALVAAVSAVRGGDVPLAVTGDTITTVRTLPFKVTAPAGADIYIWRYPAGVKATKDGNVLTVTAAPDGELTVEIDTITADWSAKKLGQSSGQMAFLVAASAPPWPRPAPAPAARSAAPIPLLGLRVLILYEAPGLHKLPKGQYAALFSRTLQQYLDTVCTADAQTPSRKAWWVLDVADSRNANLAKPWQDALKRERKSLPWLIVSDGVTGHEGPLPADEDAIKKRIAKYAPKAKEQ